MNMGQWPELTNDARRALHRPTSSKTARRALSYHAKKTLRRALAKCVASPLLFINQF